ncbi:MAG: secretin N-terminal domain-containing protein [Thermodesulfobacteriota bacterium]
MVSPLRHAMHAILAAMAVGLCLAMASCAKKEPDQFLDDWKKKAEESDASYTPQARKIDVSEAQVKAEIKPAAEKPKRDLPTMRVSLNFYDTNLQAVLRSLARIANQNIILSAALQAPENQTKYKVNLNVTETPWNQAFESILNANGLSYDWDGEIIRVMTLDDLKAQNEMKKAVTDKLVQAENIKTAEPVITVKVQVNYADVTDLEKTLQGYLYPKKSASGGAPGAAPGGAPGGGESKSGDTAPELAGRVKGFVVADKHTNSIIIQANREHAEMLVKLVEKLDEPRNQVHLKAFIVEASRDNLFDLGFQWGGFFKTDPDGNGNRAYVLSGNNVEVDADGVRTLTPIYGLGPASYGYAFNYPASIQGSATGLGAQGAALNFMWGMLNNNVLQMQLTALARDGKINIVSEPSLTTLDNMTAFTENGERIPFVTVSQNGTNVQFIDAVLRLEMTPHVIDEQNLRMKVVIKNDEVVTDQTRWVMGNPPIRKKHTDTTLIVQDGATIIISGLAKNSKTDTSQGLPGLKDVPGAGYLFGNKSKQKSVQDILVFITPTVIRKRQPGMAVQPDGRMSVPGEAPASGAPAPGARAPSGKLPPQAMQAPAPAGGPPAAAPSPRPGSPDRPPVPYSPAPATGQPGRSGG